MTKAELSVLLEHNQRRSLCTEKQDNVEHPGVSLASRAEDLLGVVTGTIDEHCISDDVLRLWALYHTSREHLVRAAALIIANIEMIDRQSDTNTME